MSILVVTAPAARRGLTTVATVKRELGITGSADHEFLEDLILQASSTIEGCCRRVFGRQVVTETFRLSAERAVLHLARWPNVALASIGEDGVTLVTGDWELDAGTGELWRLDYGGQDHCRLCRRYLPPDDLQRDLPEDLERACLETVKARWFARLHDPLVKGEQVPGNASADYWMPSTGTGDPGLPPGVVGLLQPHRLPTV